MRAPSDLPGLLRDIEAQTGLSQGAIGALAGADRSTVNRWLHGRQNPQYVHMRKLADAIRERYPHLENLASALLTSAGFGHAPARGPAQVPALIEGIAGPLSPAEQEAALAVVVELRAARSSEPPEELVRAMQDGSRSVWLEVDGVIVRVSIAADGSDQDPAVLWAEIREMTADRGPSGDGGNADQPQPAKPVELLERSRREA